ncbi:MAG: efflux RND transporter periplasmic adaptor subunit [Rhodobacteraceae bacterium]|nr:efflux RND transporter periplasmic adaptor subunit [Paracoccaceae bacterium]
MEAALAEALSRVTAAEASLAEAKTRPAASEAGVAEAEARISEAEINYNAAVKLGEGGFASETRVANALATLVSARAGLKNALSQLESARAGVQSAKSQIDGALAGVQSAKSQIEGAKAGVQSAISQVEGAKAGIQSAKSQVEGAVAGVQSARSQIEAALAGVQSANSQVEGASAGVQSARSLVENAKAGMQSAEASVAAARLEITRLEIRAPFAGLLETDTAEIGSLLQPGGLCATIVQIDPIKLVGFVPEIDIDKVQNGVMAGGRLNNGRDLVGLVTFVSRVSDPLTRTFRVEIEVDNTDKSVSDGLTVEILIASDGRQAHLLPQSSLTLDDEGNLGVRVVDSASRALFMPVDLIRDALEGVWVSGLPENAEVIVTGQEYVTDGVALDVTYREPEA